MQLIGYELDVSQVSTIDNDTDNDEAKKLDQVLAECQVEAQPAASEFVWFFLAHDQLVNALISIQQPTVNRIAVNNNNNNPVIVSQQQQRKQLQATVMSLLEQQAEANSVRWESKSSRLSRRQLELKVGQQEAGAGGLLMCKASNELGAQRTPACASLIITRGEKSFLSLSVCVRARNC